MDMKNGPIDRKRSKPAYELNLAKAKDCYEAAFKAASKRLYSDACFNYNQVVLELAAAIRNGAGVNDSKRMVKFITECYKNNANKNFSPGFAVSTNDTFRILEKA